MIWRRKNEKENRTCLLDFYLPFFLVIGFFINFMSTPPVNDTHTFTLYMIGAAVVSLLYPASMFVLGLRNRYLYDKLNELHLKTGYSRAKISVLQ